MQWFNLHEENALVAQDTAIRCLRQRKIAPMPAGTFRMRPRLIESRQNPRVKELRAALARSGRTPSGLIAIEGEHLVTEAMRSHLRFASVFLREGYEPRGEFVELPQDAEHLLLPADLFASAVSTEQPQGIAALVHPPAFSSATLFSGPAPLIPTLILVLAGLQDPGNVGTLMRSAEAFAASSVLLLPGTASPWNPKALRASAGSAFRVPAINASEAEALELLAQHKVPAIAAVAREGTPVGEAPLAGPCALLIGSEGAGLSETLLTVAAHRITIPMPGNVESLNAAIAGSLLLYETSRHRALEAARQRQQQPLSSPLERSSSTPSSRLERSGMEESAVLTSRTTNRQRPTSR